MNKALWFVMLITLIAPVFANAVDLEAKRTPINKTIILDAKADGQGKIDGIIYIRFYTYTRV